MRFLFTAALTLACGCSTPPSSPSLAASAPNVGCSASALQSSDGGTGCARPNIMLVVDRSGSMSEATPSGTRLSELQLGVDALLTRHATIARFGLALFPDPQVGPADQVCATGRVVHPIPAADDEATLQSQAAIINQTVQRIGNAPDLLAAGGTPTTATLHALQATPELNDPARHDFVVLVTDGLPNCDATEDPATCTCVHSTPDGTCSEARNCLDGEVLGAIAALRARGIRTIVVGLGADTATPEAAPLLNQMAYEGGMPAVCPSGDDAECGSGGTCDAATGLCERRYFQASDSAQLAAVLAHVCTQAAQLSP